MPSTQHVYRVGQRVFRTDRRVQRENAMVSLGTLSVRCVCMLFVMLYYNVFAILCVHDAFTRTRRRICWYLAETVSENVTRERPLRDAKRRAPRGLARRRWWRRWRQLAVNERVINCVFMYSRGIVSAAPDPCPRYPPSSYMVETVARVLSWRISPRATTTRPPP